MPLAGPRGLPFSHKMTKSDNEVSLDTLKLLESRLLRLEFNLAGDKDATRTASEISFSTGKDQSISGRLARLESSLGQLSSRSEATSELLSLRECSSHPQVEVSLNDKQKRNTPTSSTLSPHHRKLQLWTQRRC